MRIILLMEMLNTHITLPDLSDKVCIRVNFVLDAFRLMLFIIRCMDRYMEVFNIVSRTYVSRLAKERSESDSTPF